MFSHLTALLSIILSLAIALLVRFAAVLVHRRREVSWSAPQLMWAAVIFLGQIEFWLTTYDFRDTTETSVVAIIFVVAVPVLYFLQSELVVPDERAGAVDLRLHHEQHFREYIFAVVLTDLLTLAFLSYTMWRHPGQSFGEAPIWLSVLAATGLAAMIFRARAIQLAMPAAQLVIRLGLLPILAAHLSGQQG